MARFSCPMHPDVQSDRPGTCPKCGMKLEVIGQENVSQTERKRTDRSRGK